MQVENLNLKRRHYFPTNPIQFTKIPKHFKIVEK